MVIKTSDGKTVQLLIRRSLQISLSGGDKTMGCGAQSGSPQVHVEYQAQAGRQNADRRRRDVHRIPLRAALKKFFFRHSRQRSGSDRRVLRRRRSRTGANACSPRSSGWSRTRRHFLITPEEFGPSSALGIYRALRKRFRGYRIGLAPVLVGDARYGNLRRAAFLLAPTKILAYNQRLERHHLRLGTAIASLLFLNGVPLDRIFLRPKWLVPWKRDRSLYPSEVRGNRRPADVAAPPPDRHRQSLFPLSACRTAARCESSTCCAKCPRSSTFFCLPFSTGRRKKISSRCWIFARA